MRDFFITYADRGTYDIAAGINSKAARKKLPVRLQQLARRRMAFMASAQSLDDLSATARPGLNLHALKSDRAGQYAIRINDQYRICFFWTSRGPEHVEITDYH
jgi:proteic killer suppression protein